MYMRKTLIIAGLLFSTQTGVAQETLLGVPATQADIDKVFWTVFPDGEFLPDGEGNVAAGRELFEINCNLCHNLPDENVQAKFLIGKLFGGQETMGTANIDKTIGSYWPYSVTIFNYIRRAMPLITPMSLTNSEYYSLTAYLLHENGIIEEDMVINKDTLPTVEMPNRNGFVNAYPQMPEKYMPKP